jgi:hypothetical protein
LRLGKILIGCQLIVFRSLLPVRLALQTLYAESSP